MENISRREFLERAGLVGILGAGMLITSGCHIKEKDNLDDNSKISIDDLDKYHLLLTDDQEALLVRYDYSNDGSKYSRYFHCYHLTTDSNEVCDVLMYYKYNIAEDTEESLIDSFYDQCDIIKDVPAILYFVDIYGIKDYYTCDEIDYVLENAQEYIFENAETVKVKTLGIKN